MALWLPGKRPICTPSLDLKGSRYSEPQSSHLCHEGQAAIHEMDRATWGTWGHGR